VGGARIDLPLAYNYENNNTLRPAINNVEKTMTIRIVRRFFRRLASPIPVLACSVALTACDTTDNTLPATALELQAVPDTFTMSEDTALSGNLARNDFGSGRTYSLSGGPSNGTVDLSSDGTFTYQPDPDFFGEDSFTVIVTDQNGATDTATVTITVQNVPDTVEEFGWVLTWSDEFDGASLDAGNWTPQLGDGSEVGLDRWGNAELQWYQAENITVENGNLVITARAEEPVPGFPYTSGRMRSIGKVDIKYGRIEASIKPPAGQGLWSAFWMLPTDTRYGGWAASGEIDIMEVVNAGILDEAFGTVHHGFPWPLNRSAGKTVQMTPEDDFHLYAIEWEEDEIRWYIDNVHYHTVRSDHWRSYYYGGQDTGYVDGQGGAPFDVDFHILLNMAVGGFLPGSPDASTVFPAEMLVDYVRVYQCSNDPVTGTGCASWVDDSVEAPPAEEVFIRSYDLYTDAAGALSWNIGGQIVSRELAFGSFWDNGGSLVLSEVAAADPARGTVIDVNTTNSGNFSFFATDNEPIQLFGMGNNPNWWEVHAGELKFDLYVDSAGTDPNSSLLIKMDSGFPALGFVDLAVADLPLDQWSTVSVKVNDLIFNSGDQPLDTSNVVSLFVLEPTGMAHVQVDNIQLVCGHPNDNGCGITAPSVEVSGDRVNVFIDAVDPTWSNGIGAWDTAAGVDYFDGMSGNHISWELIDSGEAGHDTVIEATFAADGANGVLFIQSAAGVDLSSFAAGKLVFDLKLEAGATHGITFKVDCFDPCSSGEQTLMGLVPGEWQTHDIPVSSLAPPLDLTRVNTGIVIFPTWGDQQGVSFQLDNVRWEVGDSGGPAPATEPALVYVDAPEAGWSLWDCCGGSVPEDVADPDDPATYGNVARYTYGPNPAAGGTVNGFEAAPPMDLSGYAGGTLEFDLYLEAEPTNGPSNWLIKLEGATTANAIERPITASAEGVEPPLGAWQHYTFDLDALVSAGYNLASTRYVMVFPAWGTAEGAIVRLDNVMFNPAP
jgi:beta-glucanase (GH16 family)